MSVEQRQHRFGQRLTNAAVKVNLHFSLFDLDYSFDATVLGGRMQVENAVPFFSTQIFRPRYIVPVFLTVVSVGTIVAIHVPVVQHLRKKLGRRNQSHAD